MKLRYLVVIAAVFAVGCAGGAEEPAESTAPAAAPAEMASPADDEAALAALTADWVTHYNMGHPSMVADYHIEETMALPANAGVYEGREGVAAWIEGELAGSPTLAVTPADMVVSGDWAVVRGNYSVDVAPEGGEAATFSGNYLTVCQRVDGDWKVAYLVSNYDAPPPADTVWADAPGETPEELTEGMMIDVLNFYETHFNMGHGSMVADVFTDNGVAATANGPLASGRAAIQAALDERIAAGTTGLDIHPVGEVDMGDGWVVNGGWYEVSGSAGDSTGSYIVLGQAQGDGTYKIHWAVSNGRPAAQ